MNYFDELPNELLESIFDHLDNPIWIHFYVNRVCLRFYNIISNSLTHDAYKKIHDWRVQFIVDRIGDHIDDVSRIMFTCDKDHDNCKSACYHIKKNHRRIKIFSTVMFQGFLNCDMEETKMNIQSLCEDDQRTIRFMDRLVVPKGYKTTDYFSHHALLFYNLIADDHTYYLQRLFRPKSRFANYIGGNSVHIFLSLFDFAAINDRLNCLTLISAANFLYTFRCSAFINLLCNFKKGHLLFEIIKDESILARFVKDKFISTVTINNTLIAAIDEGHMALLQAILKLYYGQITDDIFALITSFAYLVGRTEIFNWLVDENKCPCFEGIKNHTEDWPSATEPSLVDITHSRADALLKSLLKYNNPSAFGWMLTFSEDNLSQLLKWTIMNEHFDALKTTIQHIRHQGISNDLAASISELFECCVMENKTILLDKIYSDTEILLGVALNFSKSHSSILKVTVQNLTCSCLLTLKYAKRYAADAMEFLEGKGIVFDMPSYVNMLVKHCDDIDILKHYLFEKMTEEARTQILSFFTRTGWRNKSTHVLMWFRRDLRIAWDKQQMLNRWKHHGDPLFVKWLETAPALPGDEHCVHSYFGLFGEDEY